MNGRVEKFYWNDEGQMSTNETAAGNKTLETTIEPFVEKLTVSVQPDSFGQSAGADWRRMSKNVPIICFGRN